jgi:hypothetical protein
MRIVRLYAGARGESHFADAEIELQLTDYISAGPPLYLSSTTPAAELAFMQAPSGWSSDWHASGARNLFFVLTGAWEVSASDGETRRFASGSILLVEDTSGKGHASRVISDTDSLAAMVRLGAGPEAAEQRQS